VTNVSAVLAVTYLQTNDVQSCHLQYITYRRNSGNLRTKLSYYKEYKTI